MAIAPIQGFAPATSVAGVPSLPARTEAAGGFEKVISGLMDEVKAAESQASTEVAKLAAGKTDNIHQVMLALGKSEVQFNYMMEVRNRLVEAYKEVNRMSV